MIVGKSKVAVPFVDRLAGEVHTELLEDFLVDVAQKDRRMDLAAFQKR